MYTSISYTGFLRGCCRLMLLIVLCSLPSLLKAQNSDRPNPNIPPPDSLNQRNGPPGMGEQQGQSSNIAPTPTEKGQVNFQASDSLIFEFRKDRLATLYGSASAAHESGQLKSAKISMNLDKNEVSAQALTPKDTLSKPVLIRESDKVRSDKIDYNYETEKGRFEVARIKMDQANVIGNKVKKTSLHVVFMQDAIYSTCMLDHPHWYIKADRMKVVDNDKIFFQRARLYILDIPYPLIFPFGYLPNKFDKKQSGLLEPTYAFQQKRTRGLGLQNLGWFQYFNDYLTAQASIDVFTSGTYFVDTRTNYRIRDKLNGNVQIGYSKEHSGLEPTDPNYSTNVQKRLAISHSQDFSPYASMNANINLRTADYYQRNSYDPTDRAETSTSSSISYRYRQPENLYNFNVSIRQNQNFKTNVTRLSGPDMDFNLKRFSPFSNDQSRGETSKWYENISISYQNSFNSEYSFNPERADSAQVNWFEALLDPSKYREATGNSDHYKYGFRQQSSISMGQIIPSQFLNVSANANYSEYWFPSSTRKTFLPDSNEVVERQIRGFNSARDFSTGLNFSTTIYGLTNLKIGKFESFRHTLRPSISLNYRPDFSSDVWGYYRTVQTDTTGRTRKYSIFENEVYRGPGQGEQRSLGFSLGNVFEAKKVDRDSTGEKKEEVVRLINSLNLNTNYNFAADSIKLSNLNTSLSAKLIKDMNIRANADFNFYERNESGQKIDKFLLTNSGKALELVSFSASTSYSFQFGGSSGVRSSRGGYSSSSYGGSRYGSSGYGSRGRSTGGQNGDRSGMNSDYPAHYNPLDQHIFRPVDPHFNDQPVQPYNSPFSFSVNFSYRWNLNPNGDNRKSATINANNISLQLTPKWSFRTQIGYDLVRKELTPSQFALNRNLHCWDISFTMNPFGQDPYYFFSLRINAGRIQGIIQKLPLLNNLQRSSSSSGRGGPRGFY